MGRKRNQGKARKAAAKAKARQEEEERGRRAEDDRQRLERELAEQLQQLPFISEAQVEIQKSPPSDLQCTHGAVLPSSNDISFQFALEFEAAYNQACHRGDSIEECLSYAKNSTMDEFADVWKDSAKLEMAMSFYLCDGTQQYLEGNHDRGHAVLARYLEQYIAVVLKQTQALVNWPKIFETNKADVHTLVKFYRHRIPCSCLDEKYEEVKQITKMGICWNPQCKLPGGATELISTKYCSRCRNATYCSRECQEVDWLRHKAGCDKFAAIISKFH